jgi:exodeoxyribonuclease V gamma subunit
MVIHGNHPESLRDLMVAWMAQHPLAPLEDECVLVQSNGVAQWLKLSLARSADDGGIGIAAALRTELPASFLWQAYRAVLGRAAVPAESPFDKRRLVWRLLRLLPALLGDAAFAPLHRFLLDDADQRKRQQLAERLADLLDQYQVYRADWLADWAAGRDVIATSRRGVLPVPEDLRWQPLLWRALLADVGPEGAGGSRAEVHRRFLEAASRPAAGEPPAGLPRRLVVFGISSMPQQSLEALAALARWCQVLLCVHNPSEHDWSEIVADKDLLRAARRRQRPRARVDDAGSALPGGQADLFASPASTPAPAPASASAHGQPLLAAWGKQGRDFIRLLDLHDERETYESAFTAVGRRIDCFDRDPPDTLLHQLQDDILDLRPIAETRSAWPPLDAQAERSIRFHVTHGAQREVEVLHDALLDAFAQDPALQPRDVIVMVPDLEACAPHVEAVFGLLPPGDRRRIAYSIADRGQRGHDPWLEALETLLDLPRSRLRASDVLDLLEVPALRRRFGLLEADLPRVHRWITAANVRWGLHAAQRASLDLPAAQDHNTWDFGLQRMLLGYATGNGDTWEGVAPLDEVGGLEAATLGPLVALLETLEAHWRVLRTPATPIEWEARLRALMDAFFARDDDADGLTRVRLEGALADWLDACRLARLDAPLPLSVVREHWLAQVDAGGLGQPFFGGGVTFATLMPMRALPFRWVALLGMNDGAFPRSRVAMDFDLMGRDYRPGDRSRREDDRYMFLEALLSARQHLHVSWVGRSNIDDAERPPSVLVAQLRDHIAAGWRLVGDEGLDDEKAARRLLAALTVTHRLQPFHPDYFSVAVDAEGRPSASSSRTRASSHAREWRAGWVAMAARDAAPARRDPGAAFGDGDDRDDAASSGWDLSFDDVAEDGDDGEAAHVRSRAPASLDPIAWRGPMTIARMSAFMKAPVQAFFQTRLAVHFADDDAVTEDEEPFAVNELEAWHLQDELIRAQMAARAAGDDGAAAVDAQLARIAGRGGLPAGAIATAVQQELAEPMADLMSRFEAALAAWPDALDDQPVLHLAEGAPAGLRLEDTIDGLRARPDGARCRLVLDSGRLVTKNAFRRDKLVPFWVAHVAAHLGGTPLTTLVEAKVGTVAFAPLEPGRARALWAQMVDAWQLGMRRPLPLAARSGFAWLGARAKGDDAAFEAARAAYEDHEPRFHAHGECAESPSLARAFPTFDALWSDGEFARWAEALLLPLDDVLVHQKGAARAGKAKAGAKKAAPAEGRAGAANDEAGSER